MLEYNIILPSKPKIISENETSGTYEIDGLYPGYGHTLGNSLRRIILSSIPGAAITSVKIDGVPHEFSTKDGVKEDIIMILLNLKKIRFFLPSPEPQIVSLKVKGINTVTAADIKLPSQIKILNPNQHIATITDKNTELNIEMTITKGLGYVPKEVLQKDKVVVGTIPMDAMFTPVRRVNYEVEGMRVGDRTDYNRLKISIETDGTITPNEVLENSIIIMIKQLKAIVGFKEEEVEVKEEDTASAKSEDTAKEDSSDIDSDVLKTRIESLDISARAQTALSGANIRTVGGLARKKEEDLNDLPGLGKKGIQEIKRALSNFGIVLK